MYDIFNQVKSTMNLDKNQLYGFQVLKLKLYILMYVNFWEDSHADECDKYYQKRSLHPAINLVVKINNLAFSL